MNNWTPVLEWVVDDLVSYSRARVRGAVRGWPDSWHGRVVDCRLSVASG